jgi:hypothetical protein
LALDPRWPARAAAVRAATLAFLATAAEAISRERAKGGRRVGCDEERRPALCWG